MLMLVGLLLVKLYLLVDLLCVLVCVVGCFSVKV